MLEEISLTNIQLVVDSWSAFRRIPDFEEQSGIALFQRLFEINPDLKKMFGFKDDFDPSSDESLESKYFLSHSSLVMRLFGEAFDMISPDTEFLTEMLHKLARRHAYFGVKPEYYPDVGEALIFSIEKTSPTKVPEDVKLAWLDVYNACAAEMIMIIEKEDESHFNTMKNRFQDGGKPVRLPGE